ncbi:adrenodoxin-like ferredoxin [Hamiltosporidium tvaerminnensis]|uniref:Adrenodoxin-like ferredoxin n=1 Tax=Hamiltosporidium tvaerminnensis TaxID=1176355 RepID=A0A4V2JX45_9MICR|nr:hypothetical protein LUQ84_002489 [Hamiltosporidium tvaerminnensis]TBU10412.1 adrenodoxin-like ferredoxin [Hamiltosporidium tvaerminnensis]
MLKNLGGFPFEKIKNTINVIFKQSENTKNIKAQQGDTILSTAHKNNIDLEGACEGNLACSTCHVILSKQLYNKLDEPTDREYDLLDQAFSQTSTSRLGCQLKIDDRYTNEIIVLPSATRNFSVDGYKPKPH